MSRASRTVALSGALVLAAAAPAYAGVAQAATSHGRTTVTQPAAPHGSRHLIRNPSGKLVHVLGRGRVHAMSGRSGGPAPVTSSTSGAGYGCTYTYTDNSGKTYHYCHAGAYQSPFQQGYFTAGAYASTPVYAPPIASTDYHSLWELAVEDSFGQQIIEVGWRVARADGTAPRLFVNTWKDGLTEGYNNVFFNAASGTPYYAGMTLPTGSTPKQFGIEYYQGNWWVSYDNSWFGYFSGTHWGSWSTADQVQLFGEVAAGELYPCTDMGDGSAPASGNAAHVTNVGFYGSAPPVNLQPGNIEDPTLYDAWIDYTGTGFTYGGPGHC